MEDQVQIATAPNFKSRNLTERENGHNRSLADITDKEDNPMKTGKFLTLFVALLAFTLAAACNKAGSSPTATAKAFYDAAKSKDVQGMKNQM